MQFIKWAASLAGVAAPRALPAESKNKSFFGFSQQADYVVVTGISQNG